MSLQPLSSHTEVRRVIDMLAEEFCERVDGDERQHKRRLVSKVQLSYREVNSKEVTLWIPLTRVRARRRGALAIAVQ